MCNPAGRCEPASALDRSPPALVGPVSVAPPVGSIGTRFVVALSVDEPLLGAP